MGQWLPGASPWQRAGTPPVGHLPDVGLSVRAPAADYKTVPAPFGRDRLRSLDGLRGIAALIVVLSHIVAASVGSLSAASEFGTDDGGVVHWLLRTPLAIFWAGSEFVIVFFVLSGFVLTRAVLRDRPAWGSFYVRRALRLYLPAWASLIPAALLMAAVAPANIIGGVGFWLHSATANVSAADVARDAALVFPHAHAPGASLNGPLWSLRWEVLFSAILPMLLLAAGPLRRLTLPTVGVMLLWVCWGGPTASYLAPFALGLLLALHEDQLHVWRRRVDHRGAGAFLVLCATLLTADLWLPGARRATGTAGMLVVLGAVATVFAPMLYEPVARVLQRRPVQWLGSRSFSLYLVHQPIVIAYANGLHAPPPTALAALAIPTSLLAAEGFFRVVERPSHRLANKTATGLRLRTAAGSEPQPA